jgi:uncharacterized protein YoxC
MSDLPRDARGMIGDLVRLPVTLTRSALLVPGLVTQASRILEDIAGIVAATQELLSLVNTTVTRVAKTADAAAGLPHRVARVIEDAEHLPSQAVVVIERAGGVFDRATHLVTEMDGMPERLRPLVEALADLDPGVATQLGRLIPTIGPVLTRLEDEVIPSVASLQSLVPVVELLHLNVGELQAVVAEVGKLIGSMPGASLLRRRAEREPSSTPSRREDEG